jgi:uncharacterized protein YkwD
MSQLLRRILRNRILHSIVAGTTAIGLTGLMLSAPALAAGEQPNPGFDTQMLSIINAERAAAGLFPLEYRDSLRQGAVNHSTKMSAEDLLIHADDASIIADNIAAACTASFAENIAQQQATDSASNVMSRYMSSSSHRANILDPNATFVATGTVTNDAGKLFNTQRFAYNCDGVTPTAFIDRTKIQPSGEVVVSGQMRADGRVPTRNLTLVKPNGESIPVTASRLSGNTFQYYYNDKTPVSGVYTLNYAGSGTDTARSVSSPVIDVPTRVNGISTSSHVVNINTPFVVEGFSVSPALGRTVNLEHRVNGAWEVIEQQTLSSDYTHAAPLTFPAVSTPSVQEYRVSGVANQGAAFSSPVLTVEYVIPPTVVTGWTEGLTEVDVDSAPQARTITASPGIDREVQLQVYRDENWTTIDTSRSTADTPATVNIPAFDTVGTFSYRLYVVGTPEATELYTGVLDVQVNPHVTVIDNWNTEINTFVQEKIDPFSISVQHGGNRVGVLESSVDSENWTPVEEVSLSASGAALITLPQSESAGTTYYRVNFPATAKATAAISEISTVVATRQNPVVLDWEPTDQSVYVGTTSTPQNVVVNAGDGILELQRLSENGSDWETVESYDIPTDKTPIKIEFPDSSVVTSDTYRIYYPETVKFNAWSSDTVQVSFRKYDTVLTQWASGEMSVGEKEEVEVGVNVSPALLRTVELQSSVDGGATWQVVSSRSLTTSSRASFTLPQTGLGTQQYRVFVAETNRENAATSLPLTVKRVKFPTDVTGWFGTTLNNTIGDTAFSKTVKVENSNARSVELQRLQGGEWVVVERFTSPNGNVADMKITLPAPTKAGSEAYRLHLPEYARGAEYTSPVTTVNTAKKATVITGVDLTSPNVLVDDALKYTVKVAPGGTRSYELQALLDGTWTTVSSGQTSNGSASVTIPTDTAGDFNYRVSVATTSEAKPAVSKVISVNVAKRSSTLTGWWGSADHNVYLNDSMGSVNVQVSPNQRSAVLQQAINNEWVTVQDVSLSGKTNVTLPQASALGSYRFRLVVSESRNGYSVVSPVHTVNVVKRPAVVTGFAFGKETNITVGNKAPVVNLKSPIAREFWVQQKVNGEWVNVQGETTTNFSYTLPTESSANTSVWRVLALETPEYTGWSSGEFVVNFVKQKPIVSGWTNSITSTLGSPLQKLNLVVSHASQVQIFEGNAWVAYQELTPGENLVSLRDGSGVGENIYRVVVPGTPQVATMISGNLRVTFVDAPVAPGVPAVPAPPSTPAQPTPPRGPFVSQPVKPSLDSRTSNRDKSDMRKNRGMERDNVRNSPRESIVGSIPSRDDIIERNRDGSMFEREDRLNGDKSGSVPTDDSKVETDQDTDVRTQNNGAPRGNDQNPAPIAPKNIDEPEESGLNLGILGGAGAAVLAVMGALYWFFVRKN